MTAEKNSAETPREEVCGNPFNKKCRRKDIELYIFYKGKQTPICHRCWPKLAEDERWQN